MRSISSGGALRLISALALILTSVSASAADSRSRLEKVQKSGELKVCIWPDYYSITYRNPKTCLLSGIDIDLSEALAADLGLKLQYVDSSFKELIDNLEKDHCDIAMHAVAITPERSARLQFTQPYLRSDIYAIASKNSSSVQQWSDIDSKGRVVAVQAGTFMEPVMRQTLKNAQLVSVVPPATREQEVQSGRADVFMTDFPYSRRMLDLTDWARLVAPPTKFHQVDYAWALAPGDSSLRDRVNQFVVKIKKDGRLLQFARKHKLDPIVVRD